MSYAMISARYLQQIADALRARGVVDENETIEVEDMADAVLALTGVFITDDYEFPENTHGNNMAIVNRAWLVAIANAIRTKNESVGSILVSEMAQIILEISPFYSEYDFEMQAYRIAKNSAARLYSQISGGNVVARGQWSASSGTYMLRMYSHPGQIQMIVFYGWGKGRAEGTGSFMLATFSNANFAYTTSVQNATASSSVGITYGLYGLALYDSATNHYTVACQFSANSEDVDVHLLNFTALLASPYKTDIIMEKYATSLNGSYFTNEGFIYGSSGTNIIDYYELRKGHSYLIYPFIASDYLGYMVSDEDLSTKTSDYADSNMVIAENTSQRSYYLYGNGLYRITHDCYLAVLSTKTGDSGYVTYVLDITPFK